MLTINRVSIVVFLRCLSIAGFLVCCSCNNNAGHAKDDKSLTDFNGKQAIGYRVPKDSLIEPVIILIDETKLKKVPVGHSSIILANENIHPVNEPHVIAAGKPAVLIPGKDTLSLPKMVAVVGSIVVAGTPETIPVKDAAIKDVNPQGFSSFGKLQGLKHGNVNSMLQDSLGNLWFGTNGGGVSKYDGNTFTHYTTKEGLTDNGIWCTLEDSKGNIWFGTSGNGVSKFDGKAFTNYTENEGLAANVVFCLLEDRSGNIWFGTNGGGASKYDGKTFTHYTEQEGLSNNYVLSMLEDHQGNIWFGTNGGVSMFDGKRFQNYTDKEGLPGNEIFSMLEDKESNIWFGSYGGGVAKYDRHSFTHFTSKEGLSADEILSMVEDSHGNIWFGTNSGGVSKYDGNSFTHFTDKEGLPNNTVKCILEDRSGNIWFGTHGGGVSKYNGKLFSHYTENEGLSGNIILSILKDKSNNIWLGNFGTGVSRYDGKTFIHYSETEGLPGNVVWGSLQDRLGNIWFATGGGVAKYDGSTFTHYTEKEGLASNDVRSIYEDKLGNLWFGTIGGGVSRYNGNIEKTASFTNFSEKQGLSNNDVRSILEDRSGNFWFGTFGGGLTKYDGKSFTHYNEKDGLANNSVMTILEDDSGTIWFGTYGGGISRYDSKAFFNVTEKEGLLNNVVTSMMEDKKGNLWIGTRFGLSKLSKKKMVEINQKVKGGLIDGSEIFFKNFAYEDGFLGVGCVNNSICETENGTIWIGTNDRLTLYHPEGDMEDLAPPSIQLTGIELYNEKIEWINLENHPDTILTLGNGVNISRFKFDGVTKWYPVPENLSLNYNNNYLTFNFTGVTQNQSKKVRYQYKLEGLDENWSAVSNRTFAPYGNLPPGTYTFKVKAMNSVGYWSNEINYTFNICPPFWKTWWFRVLVTLIVAGSIYVFIKSRERELNQRQKDLESKIEIATEDIKQQKHIIEEHQKGTIDSINYAKRIQYALLANEEILMSNLSEHFVLFKPKDIISGDFYWATVHNNKFYLAVCDSTGHGVPGAFMSLLNMGFLSEAIKEKNIAEPHEILNYVRSRLIDSIGNDGQQDGMDAVLLCFEKNSKTVSYAAANNQPVLVRDSKIKILPKDKMPVGKGEKTESFSLQTVELLKDDILYLYTDGYADQFGGPKGKKFKYKQLNELILLGVEKPLSYQSELLNHTLEDWKGNLEQVDDILVIGLKL
ncbi:MAG: adenylate/guanylate cyclase [Bacteroidetes bacterium]|jgi:ligand-binding sensor domain-containing protein/serine phosphatase RsbU (regulator of sigma subunit)|nr:adenylate/guanylate cyclase [Bacteroidota bacterium]MDF2452971.1 adenylate/guanylate cyclase [Bacteroidota bacterium]